jgi:ABC-2 type transport system ATP-binding protein
MTQTITTAADVKAFSMEGVVKRYRGFTLGPLDLDLEPGTVLGLVGPNGSGKTTTINVLVGLVKHDRGKIKVFGRDANPNDAKWKFDIGYVGDTHVFYEYWSGQKNLNFLKQFYPNWSDERARELADRFQLDLRKRANTLSKGNRAKLALIGALAHYPKLFLLDEPSSGLDPVVRTEFLDVLWESMEKGDTAILYSTHILSDIARIADELAFLKDGRIALRTPKDDLIDRWRHISFRLDGEIPRIAAAVSHKREGLNHLVVSSNHEVTLAQLKELHAENVQASLMTIDEIAVHILKEK